MNMVTLHELPENWVWANLADITDIIMGSSPPSPSYNKEKIGLPFYQGKTDFGSLSPTPRVWCSSPYKVAEEGDVLISVRAPVGPTNLCTEKSCIGRGLGAIRSRGGIPSLFVLFYLRSIEKDVAQMGTGSTFTAIKRSVLESLPLPLAPLNEMRRIVAKVEALFAESKTAREALDKVPALLRRFRQSILAKAFRGELTQRDPNDEPAQKLLEKIKQERNKGKQISPVENQKEPTVDLPKLPETWIWTTIGELETFIGSGITPRGGKKVYRNEGIPFIRSQNVHPDGLHLENVAYITPEMHAEMKRTQVRPNDVLLNITGASIGRSTYLPEGFCEANVNQHVCIIRTGWWIVPAYLSYFLNSTYGQDQIFATESGVTREGLNYMQVRSLWIPLAPIAEQKRVAAKIEEAFSIAEQIETAVKKARERSERIDQAILAKAFRGELVPQDPNDMPASVLLQRTKTANKQSSSFQMKLTD